MDGISLAEQITRERSDALVLLMSGGTARNIPEHMAFISKPFFPSELVARLEDILSRDRGNNSFAGRGSVE
jgi:DNA-binding response OmpR family regulator